MAIYNNAGVLGSGWYSFNTSFPSMLPFCWKAVLTRAVVYLRICCVALERGSQGSSIKTRIQIPYTSKALVAAANSSFLWECIYFPKSVAEKYEHSLAGFSGSRRNCKLIIMNNEGTPAQNSLLSTLKGWSMFPSNHLFGKSCGSKCQLANEILKL